MSVKVDVSYGELLDKISILEIKLEMAPKAKQRRNIERELDTLRAARDDAVMDDPRIADLCARLKDVNRRLWKVEDDIRDCERRRDFGEDFVVLARSVYRLNDLRARLKRDLNSVLDSTLVEEKLYQSY